MESHGQCSDESVERVYKSKAEAQIARFLKRSNIAYKYEYPLAVVDRGKTRVWYPDFYLPEYSMIIEYFGFNGKRDYDEQTRHKKAVYQQKIVLNTDIIQRRLAWKYYKPD